MPTERRRKTVLFLFPHQDDESFCATRIARELEHGHQVYCLYLTDGSGNGTDPEVRDRESIRVLGRLGLPREHLHFLGSRDRVPDGALVEHLESSLVRVREVFDARPLHRIYCLAYEGGHQDHDASHLLALAYARQRSLLGRTWQIAVYNGQGLPWILFRVDHPLDLPVRRCDRSLSFATGLRHALFSMRYPSQWKSFLVLFPEHFFKRVLLRRESFQAVSPELVYAPPHPGRLLYERLYRFPYARFEHAAAAFLASHLPRAVNADR